MYLFAAVVLFIIAPSILTIAMAVILTFITTIYVSVISIFSTMFKIINFMKHNLFKTIYSLILKIVL